ncbi:MAG TPA: MAPEG family protein [Candidatus Kapabacteria bacterium]|nr:MAPEG family protein [Candidatus Kapabacteria bacterium]
MSVTLLYTGLLALIFLTLSARVVLMRGAGGPSLGDGGNPVMLRRIRAHGNFAEYVPFILIMMGALELSGLSTQVIHGLGITLVLARLLHGYALSFTASFKFGRMSGAALTFLLLLVGGGLCLYQALIKLGGSA